MIVLLFATIPVNGAKIGGDMLNVVGRHFPNTLGKEQAPIKVAVTGAAGRIGSYLSNFIGQGRMFGPQQKVDLSLLELPQEKKALSGVVMELKDSAYPLLNSIEETINPNKVFKDADVAILVGAKPRGPGMERADLLKENASIFEMQGQMLNKHAKQSVKVCVVGNPANTNALVASKNAPNIPKKNFTAMTRLDQNRAISAIAEYMKLPVTDFSDVYIWGNHSPTMYPDITLAKCQGTGIHNKLREYRWLVEDKDDFFISKVAKRGTEIIKMSGKSSAASAASAACDHMHDWWYGTKDGSPCSMGVISDGNEYGIPENLIYSFPTVCKNGEWSIDKGIDIDEFSRKKLDISADELVAERKMALGI